MSGTWLLDLDGVVWLSGEEIPGSSAAIARLRAAGESVLFVTNNAAPTVEVLCRRLERIGVAADPTEVVTAAQAAASMVPIGGRAVAVADGGVLEALARRSVDVVDDPTTADAVIVGWTESFTYDTLATAASAVRAGARFIGTNADPTHPTPLGLKPGTGAIIAAVEVAAGQRCEYAGKPTAAMASLVLAKVQVISMVVGDQVATDGAFATTLDAPFTLVRSGVDHSASASVAVAANLAEAVQSWIARTR